MLMFSLLTPEADKINQSRSNYVFMQLTRWYVSPRSRKWDLHPALLCSGEHNTSVILYVFIRVEQDPWVGICIVICILELLDLSRHILHTALSFPLTPIILKLGCWLVATATNIF